MVYGGKTHVLPPCLFCHISCLTQPLQPIQCLEFVSWGQLLHEETWAWEGASFVGCCQFGRYACPVENLRFSHVGLHSPHGRLPSRLVCSSSRRGRSCSFFLTQRPASCSLADLPSHAARRGAVYRWSFTFSHRVEIGYVFPVFWDH